MANAFTPAGSPGASSMRASPIESVLVTPACSVLFSQPSVPCRGDQSPIAGWVCESTSPGVTVMPWTSQTCSTSLRSQPERSPRYWILPSRITSTSASARGSKLLPVRTVPILTSAEVLIGAPDPGSGSLRGGPRARRAGGPYRVAAHSTMRQAASGAVRPIAEVERSRGVDPGGGDHVVEGEGEVAAADRAARPVGHGRDAQLVVGVDVAPHAHLGRAGALGLAAEHAHVPGGHPPDQRHRALRLEAAGVEEGPNLGEYARLAPHRF